MGVVYSYLYYSSSSKEDKEGFEQGDIEEESKGSDPNYTIVYPAHKEEEFRRKAAEEAKAREDAELKQLEIKNGRISDEVWNSLSPEEKKKFIKKQRLKKARSKKRQHEKLDALAVRKNELLPWLEVLTAKQRSCIKEVMWRAPDDPSLHNYLQQRKDLMTCPNRYCNIQFERVLPDAKSKSKAPFVLGYDGKPLSEEALANFMDNRFKCHHCEAVFCAECNTIPYHLGETCDQYKLRTANPPCKVCKKTISAPPDEAAKRDLTCRSDECMKMVYNLCTADASCKHPCTGMKGQTCICLRPSCIEAQGLTQEGGDFCNICWTDELEAGTCLKLGCGHVFHRHCVEQRLRHKWSGARISFNYANCPLCSKPIESTPDYTINDHIRSAKDLRSDVKIKAMHFLKAERMLDDIKDPKHKFHGNPVDYALEIFSFYMCHKCSSPYFGGRRQCGEIMNFNPEELVCGGCSGLLSCEKEKHGRKFIQYKCRFCCSIASWFCFGRVHYCENCHNNPYQYWAYNNTLSSIPPQCPGKDKCPLGIDHPPNGFEEMSLGCSRCKMEEAGIVLDDSTYDDADDEELY